GDSVDCGQNLRGTALGTTPVDKTDERHQKERFGIARDQKKRGRMSGDHQRAKKPQRWRKFPTLAEKKKESPKTPGSELCGDEERGFSIDAKNGTEQSGQRGISGKKGNVRDFHYLVIDGGNDRLIAAVD